MVHVTNQHDLIFNPDLRTNLKQTSHAYSSSSFLEYATSLPNIELIVKNSVAAFDFVITYLFISKAKPHMNSVVSR